VDIPDTWSQPKIKKMEEDFIANNCRNLFKSVRELKGEPKKSLLTVEDQQGDTHNQLNEVLKCWEAHFNAHLNTEFNHNSEALNDLHVPNNRASSEPHLAEKKSGKE